GGGGDDDQTAAEVSYDPTTSGLYAGNVQEAIDELALGGGGGGGGGAGGAPWDIPPSSPNAADDEFSDNSFDTTKWTWLNQGSATITEAAGGYGHAVLTDPSGTG